MNGNLASRLVCALLLVGCASPPSPAPGPLPDSPPVPPTSPEPYLIRAGDELEIRFFHTPDQNVTLPVRPDGLISLPLAYEVPAAGRTPEELRRDLVQRCARELQEPEIAVLVRTFSTTYQVHVGGEVDRPGVLDINGPRTVLQAVFEAGGFLPSASPAHTLVVRRMQAGGYEVLPVDVQGVLEGRSAAGNLLLEPFDVVIVPPSGIAMVNKWVAQYMRDNIPITFTYRLGVD